MQFLYSAKASSDILIVDKDLHKYIFKVRRHDISKNLFFRNLEDDYLYEYKILTIDKKTATLQKISSIHKPNKPKRSLHIGWCIIDPSSIEKSIASLNEIGVSHISFIYCKYSQKSYKINLEKLNKILINSSQQSGRSDIIKLDIFDNLSSFLQAYPNSYLLNFSDANISSQKSNIKTIIVGCEGGFDNSEISMFDQDKIVGFNTDLILTSKTAVVSLASCLIL
jgi:16S rRNA (uracil1498-N3)-methyltransferase